jgi:tetratricopeptide (TPR) repeat protein
VTTFIVQQHGGSIASLDVVSPADRLSNTFISYVMWAWTTIWPRDLAALYPRPDSPQFALAAAAFVALLLTTVAVVAKGRRYPYLAIGWLWFVGMLVPVSGLVQIGVAARADRYMYLPVLGLLVAAVWGIAELAGRWRVPRAALIGTAVVVILLLAAATRVQAGYWRNGLALWQHALDVTTANSRAHANLGTSLAEIGRQAESAEENRKAIAIEPNMPQAHNNLALALAATGHGAEAIEEYKKAIALMPSYAAAHNNLGSALMQAGRADEAAEQYALALRGRPDDAQIHYNVGVALATAGHMPEAIREFLEAVRLEPRRAEFHFALGITYARQGADADAIAQLKAALAIDPSHDGAKRALAELEAPPTAGRGRSGRGG